MTHHDEVWASYAKGVKRIKKTKQAQQKKANKTHSLPAASPIVIPLKNSRAIDINTALDRRVEKNLRQGDIDIEARIDLHGMTQTIAYDALARFMARQVKAGKRNLLIITGKGSKGDGVLRANLPNWLQTLPEMSHILTLRPAADKHGGSGAFYVICKKMRHTYD